MTISEHSVAYTRASIAEAICARLDAPTIESARRSFSQSLPTQWFSIDNLLPEEMAKVIFRSFPSADSMRERKTIREHKYVAAQMNKYEPQAEEALFAFHDPRVLAKVSQITGMADLSADPHLYAGGLSVMTKDNFLNPHLDNSHNNDRSLYRVLNLLYYVSPDWLPENGGNLELWPQGVRGKPVTIPSLFNRLVVMTTGPMSWHSVCSIEADRPRCCVSNYYFSPNPVGGRPYFRVTTFRGRPEQPIRNLVLRLDAALRQGIRKLKPEGVTKTTHIYERNDQSK